MTAKRATETLRPAKHLRALRERYPNIWDLVERTRAVRGEIVRDWPAWCYLPISAGRTLCELLLPGSQPADAAQIAALAAWRATQGVYRISPEILDAVWDTPISGHLPVELLDRLPEWCVYLETTGRTVPDLGELHGYWAFLNYDFDHHRRDLSVLFDSEAWGLQVMLLPLLPGTSLEDSVRQALQETDREVGTNLSRQHDAHQTIARAIVPLLSLVLYLCSETAEYRDARGSQAQPENPKPERTKKGRPPKLIPPSQPRVWEVSYRLGAALRTARERSEREAPQGTHASPRPHVRRAHWHTFLAGPRDEARDRRLRWLPPLPVGVRDLDELVPVVRTVEGDSTKDKEGRGEQ